MERRIQDCIDGLHSLSRDHELSFGSPFATVRLTAPFHEECRPPARTQTCFRLRCPKDMQSGAM
jgi:hypothetical protein